MTRRNALNAAGKTALPIAIRNAHIVPVSGAELTRGTIVLRGGLIQDVGADVKIPADAWAIDGSGLEGLSRID